jgi:cell division GTPase FtsZ
MRTFGHGVGKLNREAAQIMREGYPVIADRIFASNKFHESDAIVVIASGGGGTGSGSIGPLIKQLRERVQKPVYAVVVLPFSYEERGEASYAVTNSATCLEMVSRYADAVFLLDNERFAKSDISLAQNLSTINREMVKNFYDLFTAGEERQQKFIGSKVIDAGDIKASLDGITAIGRGEISLSAFHRWKRDNFQEGVKEHTSAAGALYQADNNLSLKVDMENAGRILVLVSAPKDIITLGLLEGIATYLQDKSPDAVVRIGDYPRRGKEISVTLIASKLTKADRVEEIFLRAHDLFAKQEIAVKEQDKKVKQLWETAKGLPTLDT